jgi:hypothetical protein
MAKTPAPTMGTLIDGIWSLRESKRALEVQIKEIEEKISANEEALLGRMDKEGVDKSTGKKASVSVVESIVPVTKDWEEFIAFVIKNKYGHLVERRPAVLACRELFEQKGNIPGLEAFRKRKINIRTLS